MANQLHKKFSDNQMELMQRYIEGKVRRDHIQKVLGIGKTRFFTLIKKYKEQPNFSIEYTRKNATNIIPPDMGENIRNKLAAGKKCP